jgi:large subunit ribosomal protein L35
VPKQKTHKGAAKRMKLSAKGKVKKARAGKSHLNSTNTPKSRRQLKGTNAMSGQQVKTTQEMLSTGRK